MRKKRLKLFWHKLIMLKDFFLSYFIANYKYDYWHCPHILSDLIKEGDYFIDFRPKINYHGPFDKNGIPLLDLSTQHWAKNKKIVYSPIVISQYGLGWYSKYIRTHQQTFLDNFLKIADWLIDNFKTITINQENVSLFLINYGDGITQSGMAQGLAISMLTRAYQLTKDIHYLKKAIEAFNIFKIKLERGGLSILLLVFQLLKNG